jgi:hypothetical protein
MCIYYLAYLTLIKVSADLHPNKSANVELGNVLAGGNVP